MTASKPIYQIKPWMILSGVFIIIVIAVITLLVHKENDHHYSYVAPQNPPQVLLAEAAMYRGRPAGVQLQPAGIPVPGAKVRTLGVYYSRRAYYGAPPFIPHSVDHDGVINDNCTSCHEKGGYVAKWNAFAPLTPHPQYKNCRQCHEPRADVKPFSPSEFQSLNAPSLNNRAMPGAPPQIPHPLQLRENCVTCHSSPAAPPEIRCTHPERVQCRQCHVPKGSLPAWSTP